MNYEFLITRTIYEENDVSQRELAKRLMISLGKVNSVFQDLVEKGYISKDVKYSITEEGKQYLEKYRVHSAVILAAGIGSRFAPITYDTPKGLIKVNGERMVERQIKQLHEKNITDITIVVGYLKEEFDYLVDKFNVKLIYNPEYSKKNTISSIYYAKDALIENDSYVLVSDNYFTENIFHEFECETWYASVFQKGITKEWQLFINSKAEIQDIMIGGKDCYVMYGPAFFTSEFSSYLMKYVGKYLNMPGTDNFYWEDVYMRCMPYLPPMCAYRFHDGIIYEFESLEELMAYDKSYDSTTGSKAMEIISDLFDVNERNIKIECIKNGMTNRSWHFSITDKNGKTRDYICRMPGEGTKALIDRHREKAIYDLFAKEEPGLTEELIYFDEENGYKISKYYTDSRVLNAKNSEDLHTAMQTLRVLHNKELKVDFSFDLKDKINYYEKILKNENVHILFMDYIDVKKHVFEVIDRINEIDRPKVLCHIDSNVDNILLTQDGIKLIDWEYAAMQDPLIDIAMLALYSFMPFEDIEELISYYCLEKNKKNIAFENISKENAENLIVAYMGIAGFIWALWALYKASKGQDFGDYAMKNYRYFKNSYKYLKERKFI